MKTLSIVLLSLLFTVSASAQLGANAVKKKGSLVRVKDWTQVSMVIVPEVWDIIKDQIITQVGQEVYQDIRKNYDWKSIPIQMSVFDGQTKKDLKELGRKLDSLKGLYLVATYNHFYQGTNWGDYHIIKCPYKGNEDWDKAAKWESLYFIIKADGVE